MPIPIRHWHQVRGLSEIDSAVLVRQVYTWLITTDMEVVVVSKDGRQWQLPGGKPERGENITQTAVREIYEETGIDIRSYVRRLTFFGSYTVIESPDDTGQLPGYRQVRLWLQLPVMAASLGLSVRQEPAAQPIKDVVRYAQTVPARELTRLMPWLAQAQEYDYLVKNRRIII